MINEITKVEEDQHGVTTLPDVPGLSTEAMQLMFEDTSRNLIIPRLNEAIMQINKNSQDLDDVVINAGYVVAVKYDVGTGTFSVSTDGVIFNPISGGGGGVGIAYVVVPVGQETNPRSPGPLYLQEVV